MAELKIGLTAAIRQGFEKIPEVKNKGNKDALEKLREWISTTHPHLTKSLKTDTFSVTLNKERAKLGDQPPTATGPQRPQPTPTTTTDPSPTLDELRAARDWLESQKLTTAAGIHLLESLADREPTRLLAAVRGLQEFEK